MKNILKGEKLILNLSSEKAHSFLLKSESYFNLELPFYFTFKDLISSVNKVLDRKNFKDLTKKACKKEGVNYTILNNKDGKYSYRPFQLIHPVLYVSLVNKITEESNWKEIKDRFKEFRQIDKITCLSIPVVSQSRKKDKAEQIYQWWQEVEQKSIELALQYNYLIETDIADCYGSIYTHSIPWALHTKEKAKEKRGYSDLVGNQIDRHIQSMQYGQTNGIPQGSVLMDFIAEMVLGHADLELSKKIPDSIKNYRILRYRDDYRIFCNNPHDAEQILKLLTEIMISLGLKLNSAKTKASDEVIKASIKEDKIAWLSRKKSEKNLQKHLLIIHDHSLNFPNSGSLQVALGDYHKKIIKIDKIGKPLPIISIIVDIAYRNPRTYATRAAILSKLLCFFDKKKLKHKTVKDIRNKFTQIPNIGYLEIWLQRLAHSIDMDAEIQFTEKLCKLFSNNPPTIWNNDWITSDDLKRAVDASKIIDKEKREKAPAIIPPKEFQPFRGKYI